VALIILVEVEDMIFKEEYGDLFELDGDGVYFAHCISADFALGAGIATKFNQKYQMKSKLFTAYPNGANGEVCILIDNVFNLVTKQRYYYKPTIESLTRSVVAMKKLCLELGIKTLAMPKIGCGLDRLNWDEVKEMLNEVFSDTDIKIIIRYL
jgi:O-acetyl-ADP-ribose deacetylase (regulator of RNase III)